MKSYVGFRYNATLLGLTFTPPRQSREWWLGCAVKASEHKLKQYHRITCAAKLSKFLEQLCIFDRPISSSARGIPMRTVLNE